MDTVYTGYWVRTVVYVKGTLLSSAPCNCNYEPPGAPENENCSVPTTSKSQVLGTNADQPLLNYLYLEVTSNHAGTLPWASKMDLRFRLARIEGGAASPLLATAVDCTPLLLLNATAEPASCQSPEKAQCPEKSLLRR